MGLIRNLKKKNALGGVAESNQGKKGGWFRNPISKGKEYLVIG